MSECFVFIPESCETMPFPEMLNGHSSHTCIYTSTHLYVCGGKNNNNKAQKNCEVFDFDKYDWNEIAPMHYTRTCAAGARAGDYLFVMGGYTNSATNSIEKY